MLLAFFGCLCYTEKKPCEDTMRILLINACVREESRTLLLAKKMLSKLSGEMTEVELQSIALSPLDRNTLALREKLVHEQAWAHPMFDLAREFALADHIVIAAPYWDLGFPALLKIYLEAVTVAGITFAYSEEGRPIGLCAAKKLTYLTTAGGKIFADYGYDYVKALAQNLYGIAETECYFAEDMDVLGITRENFYQNAVIRHKQ